MPATGAPHARWKEGDTAPGITIVLPMGAGRTLEENDIVTMVMRNLTSESAAILIELTITSAPDNEVEYIPDVGDLDEVGSPEVEWIIEHEDGRVETVPDDPAENRVFQVGSRLAPIPED